MDASSPPADGLMPSDTVCRSEGEPPNDDGPPPLQQQQLPPKGETVEELQPEEIRWLYREDHKKKWSPFSGYDSLRVECKYREMLARCRENRDDACRRAGLLKNVETILVKGNLYEVDVISMKCYPIYWTGEVLDIMKGTWFNETTWQPVEGDIALRIELQHLASFSGQKVTDLKNYQHKKVINSIKLPDVHVVWFSPFDVYMQSDTTSSKIVRSVGQTLGFQKSGTKIHRGYWCEATMNDKLPDIKHLVFVIHGIGQKMDTGSIIKRCDELMDSVEKVKNKYFPSFNYQDNRTEFLPVEWRSALKLDGDTVETITPKKVKGVRTFLNSSAMDILYYTSHLYRAEITQTLRMEINRLYDIFCVNNPHFKPSGGKVSMVAHSLGSVIVYDIITGWSPFKLYDCFVSAYFTESELLESKMLFDELRSLRTRAEEIQFELLMKKQQMTSSAINLNFKVENFFCFGSPLGVFLALRGLCPIGLGTLDHIVPTSMCKRLYNIYHPADPVAYRLEPLILKHYSTILPVSIHRADDTVKTPYLHMKPKTQQSGGKTFIREKGNVFARFGRKSSLEPLSTESKELVELRIENEDMREEEKKPSGRNISPVHQTELEHRLDFELKASNFENSYISLLTAHTGYWGNQDVGYFVLTHIYPELQEKLLIC